MKFSLLSKVGIVLYEEKITKDRDYVIETLFETFLGDKTITQKEPGEDLLTFCQLCSIQEVIELGVCIFFFFPFRLFLISFFLQFDKVKVFVDILASFILHPPPNPSNAKEIVGKIVKNIQGEDFQKAVDFLPLVKRSNFFFFFFFFFFFSHFVFPLLSLSRFRCNYVNEKLIFFNFSFIFIFIFRFFLSKIILSFFSIPLFQGAEHHLSQYHKDEVLI